MGACKKIVRLILMSNISRRNFLKGAGVAALAVAAAGVLTGCGNNGGNKVTPAPTPTTKPVQVKYMLGDFVTVVGSQTINVDFTKLDAAKPVISSEELTLPEKYQKDYSIVAGNYPISKDKDGGYSLTVIVRETKGQVPLVFYVKNGFTGAETDVTKDVLPGRTVLVDADATTVDVSDVQLPDDCGYKIMDNTAEIKVVDHKRVARVWVGKV